MRKGVADFCILCAVCFHSQRATGVDMTVVMAVVQHETGRLVFNGERESGISLKALGPSHEQKVT
jgi:hypothetical protein